MLVAACHGSLSPSYVAAFHHVCAGVCVDVCGDGGISPSVRCRHLRCASGLDRVTVVVLCRRSSFDTYTVRTISRLANERAPSILQPS